MTCVNGTCDILGSFLMWPPCTRDTNKQEMELAKLIMKLIISGAEMAEDECNGGVALQRTSLFRFYPLQLVTS